jgi:WD40 repeat protein
MQKFMACFASVISQSVSHIYLSALPFSPRGIGVSEQYLALYPQTFGIQRGGQSSWPAIQSILSGHSSSVQSVAFSPDSRRIVSGSWDKSIRVWDAETGQTVLGPLKGHTGCVHSVSFCPDGRRIVSGSDDH